MMVQTWTILSTISWQHPVTGSHFIKFAHKLDHIFYSPGTCIWSEIDVYKRQGLATQENQYLSGRTVLNCGDDTATEVDHEVMILLHNSYEEAKRLIGSHREALDKIAAYLIRRETITGKEFMKIFHAVERGIEIPENLDDLVIPEEKQNTVTLDKPCLLYTSFWLRYCERSEQ